MLEAVLTFMPVAGLVDVTLYVKTFCTARPTLQRLY